MINVLKEAAEFAKADNREGLHDLREDGLVYAYYDDVGYPTQGYGTLLSTDKWSDLSIYHPKTIEECTEDLMHEMEVKMQHALRLSPCLQEPQNAWKLVAITDFIYNLGQGAYEGSTLRKRINDEQWNLASVEIKRWNRADGKVLRGLTNRRNAEAEMILKEYDA